MKQYIVGHRGARCDAPENTLKAFRLAFEQGAAAVECDVRISRDNRLMVIHDSTVDRTTNRRGWVADFTEQELRNLDAGAGERVPTLSEVEHVAQEFGGELIIEVKCASYDMLARTVDALSEYLESTDFKPAVTVCSFWHYVVRTIKIRHPEIKTVVTLDAGLTDKIVLELIKEAGADGISLEHDYLHKELVDMIHGHGLVIHSWTLNSPFVFEHIRGLGVEGLYTDYPGRFRL